MSILLMRLASGLKFAQKWRNSKLPTLLLGVAVVGGACVLAKSNPYHYLTDFTLTLSRWLSLSYFDINALIFIITWPLTTTSSIPLRSWSVRSLNPFEALASRSFPYIAT